MTKTKPTPQEVLQFQALFPRLDYLMCETILMQTEEDLMPYVNKQLAIDREETIDREEENDG